MLVICNAGGFRREKYVPMSRQKPYVVFDSDLKKRVYGPENRDACQRYCDDH